MSYLVFHKEVFFGPLYFVLFINDMPDVVHNLIALLADDAKLFNSVVNHEDHADLQQDLQHLQDWAKKLQLKFNDTKCKVLHLVQKNPNFTYTMSDVLLEAMTEETDLGVVIDNKLNFNIHIDKQVGKVNRQLGLIRRSFEALDAKSFTLLHKSLVKTLEYYIAAAHPILDRKEKLIEGVQQRATKLIPGMSKLSYVGRLITLKLPSLYYRRARGDIIEVCKYIHGIYKVETSPLVLDNNPASTRGHMYKLKKTRCNRSQTQKYFRHRVVNPWNGLPDEVFTAPTLNTLKNRLDARCKDFHYTLKPLF